MFSIQGGTGHDQLPFPSASVGEKGMAVDEQLDQLSWQLSKNSVGPIDGVVTEVTSRLGATCKAVISSLQQAAYGQPLMTLLLAAQAGYLVARLGRRFARR
jgi:hypothetical protein